MIVVFAAPQDAISRTLVESWRSHGAALLTSADLSEAGWRHYLPDVGRSTAVIEGRRVEVGQIDGVVVRWPGVFPEELGKIAPDDRAYVAAEMTAFLISWLSELKCPVLNRATSTCLMGPSWRLEEWLHAGGRLSIPVHPVTRSVVPSELGFGYRPAAAHSVRATVTVVGERCVGDVHPHLAEHARRLAHFAGVDLLKVDFSSAERDGELLGADLWLDLSRKDISDAVLSLLLRGDVKRCREEEPR